MSDTLEMKVLHPNTHVVTEQTGRVVLPGREGDNGLSDKQFAVIQKFAMDNFPDLKTWGDAAPTVRRRLRMHPNQHDFGMVDQIIKIGRAHLVNQGLSENQAQRLGWFLSILFDTQEHFDPAVQARLDSMRKVNPALINRLVMEGIGVTTQGQLTTFFVKVRALLQAPVERDDQITNGEPSVENGGEEPF